MKYREVERKLRSLGCTQLTSRRGGSHRKWFNPTTQRAAPIPDWGSSDLKLGTLRAAIRQLGIEWADFQAA